MELVFWASLAIIVYVYIIYPLILAALGGLSRPTKQDQNILPTISLVTAAYNEERVIQEKLENSLNLDYPKDRLQIHIASDGSTDATNAIVQAYTERGVILHKVSPRGGKMRALNLVIPKTQSEILVLSDANTMYQPDALRKLVRHFVDPTVGAVSGDVRLVNAADSHAHSEGLYYRYERWLQSLESRLGSIIGVDGAMYAIRHDLYRAPSNNIILDDFVISMSVARLGYRVLYEPEAVAIEEGTRSSREEFQRKIRIVAGGIQALRQREGLPHYSQPFLLFGYCSHKLFRWLSPCFLFLLFLSSIFLAHKFTYLAAMIMQALVYGSSVLYRSNIFGVQKFRWCGISYYFILVNIAALIGIWKGLLGIQVVTWERAAR